MRRFACRSDRDRLVAVDDAATDLLTEALVASGGDGRVWTDGSGIFQLDRFRASLNTSIAMGIHLSRCNLDNCSTFPVPFAVPDTEMPTCALSYGWCDVAAQGIRLLAGRATCGVF